jgi:hypothetical protein
MLSVSVVDSCGPSPSGQRHGGKGSRLKDKDWMEEDYLFHISTDRSGNGRGLLETPA